MAREDARPGARPDRGRAGALTGANPETAARPPRGGPRAFLAPRLETEATLHGWPDAGKPSVAISDRSATGATIKEAL